MFLRIFEVLQVSCVRLCRRVYILCVGMWRGETIIDGYDSGDNLTILATGPRRWKLGEKAPLKFWFERKR